jgi:hypothetical protein
MSWARADLGSSVSGLSCPSAAFCAGVDFSGRALVSTSPTGGAGSWSFASIDSSRALASISCPSTELCVAGDTGGNVVVSSDPQGGPGAWTLAHIDDNVGEEEAEKPTTSDPSAPSSNPLPSPTGSSEPTTTTAEPPAGSAVSQKPLMCHKGFKKRTIDGKRKCVGAKQKHGANGNRGAKKKPAAHRRGAKRG